MQRRKPSENMRRNKKLSKPKRTNKNLSREKECKLFLKQGGLLKKKARRSLRKRQNLKLRLRRIE